MVSRPSTRTAEQVQGFYQGYIANTSDSWEANSHLPFVMQDVASLLSSRAGIQHAPGVSEYSTFLRNCATQAHQQMLVNNPLLSKSICASAIQGPVAFGTALPYRDLICQTELPEYTRLLFNAIYTWLFAFLGKSSDFSEIRFLDSTFSYPLELLFVISAGKTPQYDEIRHLFEVEFHTAYNFLPAVEINFIPIESISPEHVLTSFWISGADVFSGLIEDWLNRTMNGQLQQDYLRIVEKIAERVTGLNSLTGLYHQSTAESRILEGYIKTSSNPGSTVLIEQIRNSVHQEAEWYKNNANFFQTIKENDYDSLLVEDATKNLADRKGYEKDNAFTICKVIGAQKGELLVPARNVILKLRGLTHYRGATTHYLDLIKEFACYGYIYNRLPSSSPYFQENGPLLLTCEKLNVPFPTEETSRWIGFFLEELKQPERGKLFTSRVIKISDFWSLHSPLRTIFRDAKKHKVILNRRQVISHLLKLAEWLWSEGLSIDYCDAVFFLDDEGNIECVKILDLERLSFGELVNERHIVLDTIIDIKTYLRKDQWDHVLLNEYLAKQGDETGNDLKGLKKHLLIKPGNRVRVIKTLHTIRNACFKLGTKLGKVTWKSLLKLFVIISSTRYLINRTSKSA